MRLFGARVFLISGIAVVLANGCSGGGSPSPTPTVPPASATPSPTAAATQSPSSTPSPLGTPAFNPTEVQITSVAEPVDFSVGEDGYPGVFTLSAPSCAGVATIASISPPNPPNHFKVTGETPGFCSANFTDSFGQTSSLKISVTTSSVTLQ